MKLELLLAAAVTTAAVSLDATAQEWKLVAVDTGQLTFADIARVARNEIAASLWALESFPAVRYIGDGGIRTVRGRCATCSTAVRKLTRSPSG